MKIQFEMGRWIWLFPIVYAVHIVEELTGGQGFAAWLNAQTRAHFTTREFVVLNAIGLLAMAAGVVLVRRAKKWRWITTTLAAIAVMNALLHVAAAAATNSYSPGLVSGLALWFPLGAATLRLEWRYAQRSTFIKGLIAAAVFHILLAVAFFVI